MSTPQSESSPTNPSSDCENENETPDESLVETREKSLNNQDEECQPEPEIEPEVPETPEPEPEIKEPEPEPEPEPQKEVVEQKEELKQETFDPPLQAESALVEERQPESPHPKNTPITPEESQSPIPDPPTMDEIASSELESLKFSEADASPLEHHNHRVMQNNENETVEVKKQISPTPMNRAPARSGIRPPSAILRTPKIPVPAASIPRPSNTATPSAPRTISTPRQSASTAPSPRPISKMSRERSDVQKSTSTRSIDNVGKFTPKVNAKFVNVKSKVGSVTNHRPGGGNVEIFSEKKQYQAQSKVGSLKNATHVPGGGNVQIESRKLDFSYASPKVGSKTDYQPARSDVKIVSEKLTWQAKSKVGSMDNAAHKPTGGNVQILSQKLNWKAESKVGSKDNMNHRPGGGNVKIFDEKIRYVSSDSSRNHSALDISSL